MMAPKNRLEVTKLSMKDFFIQKLINISVNFKDRVYCKLRRRVQ